jgi:RNA polymerase sigma factor for flagellar operon FliA
MSTLVAQFLRAMWKEYRRQPSLGLRDCLVEYYLPVVHQLAGKMHKRLPAHVRVEDLISAGSFGLLAAMDRFDLGRGNKFETFARPVIRGAILDYLRDIDFLPRQERSLVSKLTNATDVLQLRLGRPATALEIQQHLGISSTLLSQLLTSASAGNAISLSRPRSGPEGSKELFEGDLLSDKSQPTLISGLQRDDLKEQITRGLSRSERLIILLYYYEDLTLKEIGRVLDLSESRVSQMRTTVIKRLRVRMQGREQELAA